MFFIQRCPLCQRQNLFIKTPGTPCVIFFLEPNNDRWEPWVCKQCVLPLRRRHACYAPQASPPLLGVGSKEKSPSRMPQGLIGLRPWNIEMSVRSCRFWHNFYELLFHNHIIINFKQIAKFFNL